MRNSDDYISNRAEQNKINLYIPKNSNDLETYQVNINYININLKSYSKKNVMEVNKLNGFFDFNKNKENFCKKCNEPALFIRHGKAAVKCLNCLNTVCKYCLKPITFDHFDLNSFNYCRVYFRKKLKLLSLKSQGMNKIKAFLISFLMIIASYLLFFVNSFSYLSKFVKILTCLNKYDNKVIYYKFVNLNNKKKFIFFKEFLQKIQNEKEEKDDRQKLNIENNIFRISSNFELENNENIGMNNIIENEGNLQFYDKRFTKETNPKLTLQPDNINLLVYPNINSATGNNLQYKRICSEPDNKQTFFYENINLLKNKKNEEMENIQEFKEDFFIVKLIKNIFYFVLFFPFSFLLFFFLIMIIPYFPLVIILFQV